MAVEYVPVFDEDGNELEGYTETVPDPPSWAEEPDSMDPDSFYSAWED